MSANVSKNLPLPFSVSRPIRGKYQHDRDRKEMLQNLMENYLSEILITVWQAA
jgi:hypothetical protein